jgi:hypothetical protein
LPGVAADRPRGSQRVAAQVVRAGLIYASNGAAPFASARCCIGITCRTITAMYDRCPSATSVASRRRVSGR